MEHWQMILTVNGGRREKLVPVPLCPPQIPHSLSRGDRPWA